jgi:ABC-2 type transport system permease protein
MRRLTEALPLALANRAIREPWLDLGTATGALLTTAIALTATALAARRGAY